MKFDILKQTWVTLQKPYYLQSRNWKIQYVCWAAILKMTLLKFDRLLTIYTSIVLLKFGVDNQSQTKVRVQKQKTSIWPPGSHFESGVFKIQQVFCLWPQLTCTWHLKLKFQSNHALETMAPTDRWIQYTPSNFVKWGYEKLDRIKENHLVSYINQFSCTFALKKIKKDFQRNTSHPIIT